MKDGIAEASPRFRAKIAGVFYLLTFLAGGVALFFCGSFVVFCYAAATATNILAHNSFFQLVFAANLIVVSCYIAVTALL
jgi:hypothetical protein